MVHVDRTVRVDRTIRVDRIVRVDRMVRVITLLQVPQKGRPSVCWLTIGITLHYIIVHITRILNIVMYD